MIDIHSHILPGIDDGAGTLNDSVKIVRELAKYGIDNIIATPHYVNETNFMSPRVQNAQLLMDLRQRLITEGIETKIFLGNEIYIDQNILDLLKRGKITTLANSRYLLVELPLNDEFPNYEDILRDLIDSDYKVILAHPERYTIVQKDYEVAKNLSKMGILFQCNMGSMTGKYGKSAKKLAKRLAKDKMIFTFGSDVHHYGRSEYLLKAFKKLGKYYSRDEMKKLLVTNPAKILANK